MNRILLSVFILVSFGGCASKPISITVEESGTAIDGNLVSCKRHIASLVKGVDRKRQIIIIPAAANDRTDSMKIENYLRTMGFKNIEEKSVNGGWVLYSPGAQSSELSSCENDS